jgi:mRNA interferase RelE/StbE
VAIVYEVRWLPKAQKDLKALPGDAQTALLDAADGLAADPYPRGCKKLQGAKNGERRIRVGDYRLVYVVDGTALLISVTRVGDRKEIYR